MSEPNITPFDNDATRGLQQQAVSKAAERFGRGITGPRETAQKIGFIKIDHKNAEFILPGGEAVEEIAGYPIYYFKTRRFYKKAFRPGERGQPPDCYSLDMIEPHAGSPDRQADDCASCPHSQFNTARDGRSQACSTFVWVFLLNSAFKPLPLAVLLAPPSSIRALLGSRFEQGYFGQAESRYSYYELVWTKFRLEEQGGDQVAYSVLRPIMGRALESPKDDATIDKLIDFRNKFIQQMDEFRGRTGLADMEREEGEAVKNDAGGTETPGAAE